MGQVSFSGAKYTGTNALVSARSLASGSTELAAVSKKLAHYAIVPSILNAYMARVLADGGIITDLASLAAAGDWLVANSVALADIEAVSPAWGVKLAGGNVTKMYSLGSSNDDFAVAGSTATISETPSGALLSLAASAYFINAVAFDIGESFIMGGAAGQAGATPAIIMGESAESDLSFYNGSTLMLSTTFVGRKVSLATVQADASPADPSTPTFLGLAGVHRSDHSIALYQDGSAISSGSGADKTLTGTNRYLIIGVIPNGSTGVFYAPGLIAESWFIKSESGTLAASLSAYLGGKF
jgi:hypothetical protein